MRYRSVLVAGSPTLRIASVMALTVAVLFALAGGIVAAASLLPSPVVRRGHKDRFVEVGPIVNRRLGACVGASPRVHHDSPEHLTRTDPSGARRGGP
jgi:hypothetical protein